MCLHLHPTSLCASIESASLSVISLLWSCFITLCCIYQMSLQASHQTNTILLLLHTSGEAVNRFKGLLLRRVSTVLSRRPKQWQQRGRKNRDDLFSIELFGNGLRFNRTRCHWHVCDFDNYRPISKLSCLPKILESFSSHSVISRHQLDLELITAQFQPLH